MAKTKQVETRSSTSAVAPLVWRSDDPWPRMMQWIDAWLPADVGWRTHPHSLRMEEIETEDTLTLRIEFPGVNPESDIDIAIDNGHLTVSGRRQQSEQTPQRSEFYYGEFLRSVPLPSGVDEGSVTADYTDGILEVKMHLADGKQHVRHVPIAVNNGKG